MQKINSEDSLREAILQLEIKRSGEGKMLKEQFNLAYESVKPINLIKSTFKEVTASQDLKDNLLNTSVGIATGYLSKILFEGATHSPIKKLIGTVLMFGVTNAVARNPEVIKSLGKSFFRIISEKLDDTIHESKTYYNETRGNIS